jgi:hypothetical protein
VTEGDGLETVLAEETVVVETRELEGEDLKSQS